MLMCRVHYIKSRSNHLFFECPYSAQWEVLTRGILKDQYTVNWKGIINLLVGELELEQSEDVYHEIYSSINGTHHLEGTE